MIISTVGTLSDLPIGINIYLDGSGGHNTSDPRNRTCGWAWVCTNGETSQEIGEWGSLEDEQTVPRAEACALLQAIRAIFLYGVGDAIYVIYSDSQVTINRGRSMQYIRIDDQIWHDMKCMKEVLDARQCQIDLRKVKSHATQEEMDRGLSS